MKLTVFQSHKGDCLLLEGSDAFRMLVDGGMVGSFKDHAIPALADLNDAGQDLDLVYLSHIDEDHISGVLELMNVLVDWEVFDFQHDVQNNTDFRKPRVRRPPKPKAIWHNAFHEQVDANRGDVAQLLAASAASFGAAAALESQTALTQDSSSASITHSLINKAFAKRGDKAGEIVSVAMHSVPYFDLITQALTDKVPSDIGGGAIAVGSVPIFGRAALVSDSAALTDANGSAADTYNSLGLVPGAIQISQSEPETIVGADLVTGLHNLVYRFQAEWAYNVKIKGFQWDVGNGGANPTDANVGTTTNWDQIDTSDKTLAGVLLVNKAA